MEKIYNSLIAHADKSVKKNIVQRQIEKINVILKYRK